MILTVRKKPVVVEAVQWVGTNKEEIDNFVGYETKHSYTSTNDFINIMTLEGTMIANLQDYIIKGVSGEFYPCKPDIFNKTYEIVTEGSYMKGQGGLS